MRKILKKSVVVALAVAWVFSGWPQVNIETRFGSVEFPQAIPHAYAATTTQAFTSIGYQTWTVPGGVTFLSIACWGGGGSGFDGSNSGGGAGGGGGAFASSTQTVSANDTIRIFVGAGGTGNSVTGATSTASTTVPATIVAAASGGGGDSVTTLIGRGGLASLSTGLAKNNGGNGGQGRDGTGGGATDEGGGGGGAGGPHGAGAVGTNGSSGAGGDGGDGDAGSGGSGATANGGIGGSSTNGGGGGGGGINASTGGDGGTYGAGGGGGEGGPGDGMDGACEISYDQLAPTVATDFASNVRAIGATLNGTKTGGGDATGHGFEYGTDSTFATVIATTTKGSLTSNSPFNSIVGSLSADTTYWFRAYATNTTGLEYGVGRSFITGNDIVTRKMRLFSSYKIKFFEGKVILHQK